MSTRSKSESTIDLTTDLIVQTGELAFATRLKRLAERLQRDISLIYNNLDFQFESRWFPVLYLLKSESPLSITDMSRCLGLTHPAVNQITVAMAIRGLVDSSRDSNDERRRLVFLTSEGQRIASELEPVWETIRRATNQMIRETGHDALEVIHSIESALDREPMYARVSRQLPLSPTDKAEIVHYKPSLQMNFRLLNEEWLTKYFTVEPSDEQVFADPEGYILKPGGAILFARLGKSIVGTVALIRHTDEVVELAKMAVTERAQGRGIGRLLGEAAIARARQLGAKDFILETNDQLLAAVGLYRALGFEDVDEPLGRPSEYSRSTCWMRLALR